MKRKSMLEGLVNKKVDYDAVFANLKAAKNKELRNKK